ncbi:hypothetical protein U1Q18_000307 [Sarracenia purpurea var. burkii]
MDGAGCWFSLDSACRLKPLAPSGFAAGGGCYLRVWLLALLIVRWCFGGFLAVFDSVLMFGVISAVDSPRRFFRSDLAAARRLSSELVFV